MSIESVLVVLGISVLLMLAGLIYVGIKLIRAIDLVRDPRMPSKARWVFGLAVAYTLSPVDILPDPILIDDIGVILLCLRSLSSMAEVVGIAQKRTRQLPVIEVQERRD